MTNCYFFFVLIRNKSIRSKPDTAKQGKQTANQIQHSYRQQTQLHAVQVHQSFMLCTLLDLDLGRDKKSPGKEDTTILQTQSKKKKKN